MTDCLFTHVRIFDGSGRAPYPGQVLVRGTRIAAVAPAGETLAAEGAAVIDGGGDTLMPGLVEAHAHLSWPSAVDRIIPQFFLPPEEGLLVAARNARILLDHGFTSAYSAGALGKRFDVALKGEIEGGWLPGPRLRASSIEQAPPGPADLTGGTANEFGTGPEAIRRYVRSCAALGIDTIKFLLSGEDALVPGSSQLIVYSEAELAAAAEAAAACGLWLSAHAQAAEAVKQALRHGFRVIYHCSYADEAALDGLEARKAEIFMAPAIGVIQATLEAEPPPQVDMTAMKEAAVPVMERARRLVPELHRRGVRVLPGGDYGFPFNPNGRNARDLELFVRLFGYTPTEALVAATKLGGELMDMALGQVREGWLADLLLVRGDPTVDVAILQDPGNLRVIMKGGAFHKRPAP